MEVLDLDALLNLINHELDIDKICLYAKGSYEAKYKLPQACNFIKKEILAQMFSCELCETSKNTFLKNTSGRLLLKPQYDMKREVAKISAL